MQVGVPTETAPGERRVALVPDVVRKLTAANHTVLVETGAGVSAAIPDAAFTAAGAEIASADQVWAADVVATVKAPSPDQIERLERGSVVRIAGYGASDVEAVAIVEVVWHDEEGLHAGLRLVEPSESWARLVECSLRRDVL